MAGDKLFGVGGGGVDRGYMVGSGWSGKRLVGLWQGLACPQGTAWSLGGGGLIVVG